VQSLRVQPLVWCKSDLTNLFFHFIDGVRHVSSISDSLDTSCNAALKVIWMFPIVLCTTYQNCMYIAQFSFNTSFIISVGCRILLCRLQNLVVICHALCWSKCTEQSYSSDHLIAKAKVMHQKINYSSNFFIWFPLDAWLLIKDSLVRNLLIEAY
jgi:hypothetical protein